MQKLKPGKQPAEIFWISADFSEELEDGESVVLEGSSVAEESLSTIDDTEAIVVENSLMVGNGSTSLLVQLSGGVVRDVRKLSFRAATSEGNLYELDVKVPIFD